MIADDARKISLAGHSADLVVTTPSYSQKRDFNHGLQIGLAPTPAALFSRERVRQEAIGTSGDEGACLNRDALPAMRAASLSRAPISLGPRRTNSPHEFYRYPGRFSPAFARAVIDTFSKTDDLILDPFVGGGTTAVEALVSGRRSLVADLNPLATLVTRVKTRPLPDHSRRAVRQWIEQLPRVTLLNRASPATCGDDRA